MHACVCAHLACMGIYFWDKKRDNPVSGCLHKIKLITYLKYQTCQSWPASVSPPSRHVTVTVSRPPVYLTPSKPDESTATSGLPQPPDRQSVMTQAGGQSVRFTCSQSLCQQGRRSISLSPSLETSQSVSHQENSKQAAQLLSQTAGSQQQKRMLIVSFIIHFMQNAHCQLLNHI